MKKRILAVVLAFLMVASATSCTKNIGNNPDTPLNPDNKIETQNDGKNGKDNTDKKDAVVPLNVALGEGYLEEYYPDSYDTVIEASYPVVELCYGDEDAFPKLSQALKQSCDTQRDYQVEYINENYDYAKEVFEYGNEYFTPFTSEITPFVRRADTKVVSILCEYYEYNGGVQGHYYYYGDNYDTGTGELLELSDVVTDIDLVPTAISEQLGDEYELDDDVDVAEIIYEGAFYTWTLDYNGITFYFLPFALSSQVFDVIIVTLENNEYPDILKQEYQSIPDAYAVQLPLYLPLYYDNIPGGIYAGAYASDYEGNPGEISISVGEDFPYFEENWFYDCDAYYVHTADGENYVYYELLRDNDYRETVCYKISDGVEKIGSVDGGLEKFYKGTDEFVTLKVAMTNPENFRLFSTTQCLSTATGYKNYRVGRNGLPVTEDEYFGFENENAYTFTLLQELDAEIYDRDSKAVVGSRSLKAGDKVIYSATDGEKYALLECADGMVCRVMAVMDYEEYVYRVNGISIEELFDGIVFAG